MKTATKTCSVGEYLLIRLKELGAFHIFGVAGDYLFNFLDTIEEEEGRLIACCNEQNAGYAADGYARLRGLGAVAVAFNVGEFAALNAVAGAYCEHVPLVVIAGNPSTVFHNRKDKPPLHHSLGTEYLTGMHMAEAVTVANEFLGDAATAPEQIDRALRACLYHKQPIYFCLPSNVVTQQCEYPEPFVFQSWESDQKRIEEVVEATYQQMKQAKRPMIIGGAPLIFHQLEKEFGELVDKTGFPCTTLFSAKGLISEHHPCNVGLYQGKWGFDEVREVVEGSDCVLIFETILNELDSGGETIDLKPETTIKAGINEVIINNRSHSPIFIGDFIRALNNKFKGEHVRSKTEMSHHFEFTGKGLSESPSDKKMTISMLFERVDSILQPGDIIVVDTGCGMFCSAQMQLPDGAKYVGQTDYTSIGYGIPALLGVCVAAQDRRSFLFVGDGAFQESGQELSTLIRYGYRPIIFLLNNDGYTTERLIREGFYNDLNQWKYHQIPQIYGDAWSADVHTERDLVEALKVAESNEKLSFIEVHLERMDCGQLLERLGNAVKQNRKNDAEPFS